MMAMHVAAETKGQRRRYKAAVERYFSDMERVVRKGVALL